MRAKAIEAKRREYHDELLKVRCELFSHSPIQPRSPDVPLSYALIVTRGIVLLYSCKS